MSVQTQIDRLESAKEAIATAIAGKGVTVPDGTLIDGMAALIASIEAGGGGGSSEGAELTLLGKGTFTGNNESSQTVTHGLGVTPKVFVVNTAAKTTSKAMTNISIYHGDGTGAYFVLYQTTSQTNYYNNFYADTTIPNWNNETVDIRTGSYNVHFKSIYNWWAFG